MSDWRPISTVPANWPVELGTFPCAKHTPNLTVATSVEALRAWFPRATHWRVPSEATRAAVLKNCSEPLA